MPEVLLPQIWGVERPLHDEVKTSSQMIDVIHDMLARYEETARDNGYALAPGPVLAIAYAAGGKRIARVEGPVLPVAPADDVVPL